MTNLFDDMPQSANEELFTVLLDAKGVRIERIVSTGQSSPEGFWYDQPQDEWVVLLDGAARLRFADGDRVLDLKPGEFVNIRAHQKHRVEWTAPDRPTVWLAVHYDSSP